MYSENFGILKNVTSTGNSLALCIAYMDPKELPHFFKIEFGIHGKETEEDRRLYHELFGIVLREDGAEDLCLNEFQASAAGDIVADAFEGGEYRDKVLYFTGQPDQQGAYSIEQIHATSLEYLKSIPGDLYEEVVHLTDILEERKENSGRN